MDFKGLIDMEYFWWAFNKVAAVGAIFLVIFLAFMAAGWLLNVLVNAFKNMRN